ncbi:hypothetical protein [Lacipirellula sp.]|uniref:hypothetical protein n=1 Tax=Lacipirellula sp. TaxID=2691419 RepID=UPI003D10EE16
MNATTVRQPTLRTPVRAGVMRLEVILVAAFLALLLQIVPSLWAIVWQAIDVRQWPRAAWMTLNVFVILALFGVRFGPSVATIIRERWKQPTLRGQSNAPAATAPASPEDYGARRRRDAEWAKRANKRLPWQ